MGSNIYGFVFKIWEVLRLCSFWEGLERIRKALNILYFIIYKYLKYPSKTSVIHINSNSSEIFLTMVYCFIYKKVLFCSIQPRPFNAYCVNSTSLASSSFCLPPKHGDSNPTAKLSKSNIIKFNYHLVQKHDLSPPFLGVRIAGFLWKTVN